MNNIIFRCHNVGQTDVETIIPLPDSLCTPVCVDKYSQIPSSDTLIQYNAIVSLPIIPTEADKLIVQLNKLLINQNNKSKVILPSPNLIIPPGGSDFLVLNKKNDQIVTLVHRFGNESNIPRFGSDRNNN